jgi:hypothetical protein
VSERFSCARESQERDEPLYATASTVRRWIFLEQPGPWGYDAVEESRLPARAAAALIGWAHAARARLVLIRRHGRDDAADTTRACFLAVTHPDNDLLERFDLASATDLLDLDPEPLRRGESVGGSAATRPLYLVCTNGSHDPCCAEFGRPLVAALDRVRPEETWECSHIGGDRFAGNLVVVPHGLYFGRVGPDEGIGVVEAYEDGRIALDHYRGRSCYPFHVQAAEHLIRAEHDIERIDALRLVAREPVGQEIVIVTFVSDDGRRFVARLSVRPDPEGQLLTCRATGRACPPRYELLDLEVVSA